MKKNHEKRPVLYSFRRCPYAMRARLGLAISAQTCVLREIVLRDKPAEMLALSPKGTVPVLGFPDGAILEESLDIMHWALSQNDPEQWLGQTIEEEKQIAVLIAQNDNIFKAHLDRYKYPNRFEGEDALKHRAKAENVLEDLEKKLGTHGFLVAPRPTLADFAIFPFIRQFAHTDKAWFDQAPYPLLQSWLESFLASDLFGAVMTKFKPWQEAGRITGEVIIFPKS